MLYKHFTAELTLQSLFSFKMRTIGDRVKTDQCCFSYSTEEYSAIVILGVTGEVAVHKILALLDFGLTID